MIIKTKDLETYYHSMVTLLDGPLRPTVTADGKTHVTRKPFKLSGKTRIKLTEVLTKLRLAIETFGEVRTQLIKQVTGGEEELDEKNEAQLKEFQKEIRITLNQEVPFGDLTSSVELSDLKLDDNDIPGTVLDRVMGFLSKPSNPSSGD